MLRIYQDAIEVLRLIKPEMNVIGRHDPDLARQLRRCSSSIVLNIAEGSYARKGNRQMLYNVALGSAKETKACLDVAQALGYLESTNAQIERKISSICAVLYKLT
jgi:four helix bundle protein